MFDLLTTALSAPLLLPLDINIGPNSDGLPGISPQLDDRRCGDDRRADPRRTGADRVRDRVGLGANSSNPHFAGRGSSASCSCGAAVISGASVTLVNFFWNVGQQV